MAVRTFDPVSGLTGELTVPADKSVAHRAMMLAGMVGGSSLVRGRVSGEDVDSTRGCMQALGVQFRRESPAAWRVTGRGFQVPGHAELDCGNSGTTMRLLAGALAGRSGRFRMSGDASLSRRPMGRVAAPLRLMGAGIEAAEGEHPPLVVTGGSLKAISYRSPVASAQVKSALLLAGLQASGTTTVIEPCPSRDHTERLLSWLGCRVGCSGAQVSVVGGDELFEHEGFEINVPGDLSSAAFWLVAAILARSGSITVREVGLNPGRTGILEVLSAMGARIEIGQQGADPEPSGTVTARYSMLEGTVVSGSLVPRLVDELPLVALAATQAEGVTVIRDAAELRLKETDRIAVLCRGLRSLGARIEEQPDGMVIEGPTPLAGGVVDASGDHRMALTFAIAGLIGTGPVTVRGWEAAAVSYPGFVEDLQEVQK